MANPNSKKAPRWKCPKCGAVDDDDFDPYCDGTIFVDHEEVAMVRLPDPEPEPVQHQVDLTDEQIDVLRDALSFYQLSGYGTGHRKGDVLVDGTPCHDETALDHIRVADELIAAVERVADTR